MTDKTPERIWVVYAEGSESRDELPEVFAALEEWELAKLTKCYESPALPFVRADLHAAVVAERDQLKAYARETTIALTETLNVGGSEFFAGRIGEFYKADIAYCVKSAERRFEGRNRLEVARLKSRIRDLEDQLTELEKHRA